MQTHQTSRADEFQVRFNIDKCLIADKGRSLALPVPWEGQSAASNPEPTCSCCCGIGVIWAKTILYFPPFCGKGKF